MARESILKGKKVGKDSLLLETIGSLDELISFLGAARTQLKDSSSKKLLLAVQGDLSNISAVLTGYKKKFFSRRVEFLEKQINKRKRKLPPLKRFILPGKEKNSAWLHLCRTVCRRVERRAIALSKKQKVDAVMLDYLNKLSTFLFLMARASC